MLFRHPAAPVCIAMAVSEYRVSTCPACSGQVEEAHSDIRNPKLCEAVETCKRPQCGDGELHASEVQRLEVGQGCHTRYLAVGNAYAVC